ncbi:MAG TPA: efflux RND transporter permease subunit, partial [Thermoanaerobaculia bacterium]|nr:efflux RND transporter permease subunit [Thermoanaerobaculia bacterium]
MNLGRIISNQKRAVLLVIALLSVGGLIALARIPRALFPQTDFPRIIIVAENGVSPAQQTLVSVTKPIEEAMSGIPGIARIKSTTARGSAEIDLFFDWRTDIVQTLQIVQAKASQLAAKLPPGATFERADRLTFAVFPIIGYSITSSKRDPGTLRNLAEVTLRPPVARIDGVASVQVQGGQLREYHVLIDRARLEARGVSLPQVADAVRNANVINSPGLINENHQLELALVSGQASSIDDLSAIVVTTVNNVPVRIGDVATVSPGLEPRFTIVTADGRPAVLLNVLRQPTANIIAVADDVKAEVTRLKKTLPSDVEIRPYYDQSLLVSSSVSSVRDAILIGLLLSVAILYGFLRNWGTTFVATLVIPVTVLVTFVAMWIVGLSFDLMTLGGVAAAIGLVIDDAIVVVENIYTHLVRGESRADAVRNAVAEISGPIIGSTITPVVVFLPLALLTGITGVFFRSLALTMSVALLTSLFLALTFTPVLAEQFIVVRSRVRSRGLALSGSRGEEDPHPAETAQPQDLETATETATETADREAEVVQEGPLLTRLINSYDWLLGVALARRGMVLIVIAVLAVLTFFIYKGLGSEFLPEFEEHGFILDYKAPPGASLDETDRMLQHVERMLKENPAIDGYSRRTGMQLGLAGVTEPNTGDFAVKLKESASTDEVTSELRHKIESTEPALRVEFPGILSDLIGDLVSAPQPIEIRVFSEDTAALHHAAEVIKASISKVSGVVDVFNGIVVSGPAVVFQIDPQRAALYGVTAADVNEAMTTALGGDVVSSMIEHGRATGVRVLLGGPRPQLDELRALPIRAPSSSSYVRIDQIATINYDPGQTEIGREGLRQSVSVTARLEGRDLGSAIKDIQSRLGRELHLPTGTTLEYGGLYQ